MTLEELAQQQTPQTAAKPEQQKLNYILKGNAEKQKIGRELDEQENKRKRAAADLQISVLKGLKAGENIYSLFLKAYKANSLLRGCDAEYIQAEQYIKTVYGQALNEQGAAELIIREIKTRLERLQATYKTVNNSNDRRLLENAIKSHTEELQRLQMKA